MNKIYIIVGSTRTGRVGDAIAEWFYQQTSKQKDFAFEIVDLHDWNLPFLNEPIPARVGKYHHDHTKKWSEKISQADGYIFVTPEYNAGYPAALKNALDYLHKEWGNKPVSFVSYGWGGGRRAVKQLSEVVADLGMTPLSSTVAIVFTPQMFENNQLKNTVKDLVQYEQPAKELLTELQQTRNDSGIVMA